MRGFLAGMTALIALVGLPTPTRPASSTVATVGDSISAGYLIPDPGRTYPQVLGDRLFGRDHSALRVIGHGGQCLVAAGCVYPTPLVDTWQAEVLDVAPSPTTILVEIGTNDLTQGVTDATMESAYQTLVSSATTRNIRVIVGTIPPRGAAVWSATYESWGPQRERINAWIRATFPNVADFDAALRGPDGYARPEIIDTDGLHPNEYGADDMAYCVPLGLIT